MSTYALHLHRLHVPNPSGIHRYARELATALQDGPDAVTLWTGREDAGRGDAPAWERTLPAPRRLLHGAWTVARAPALERLVGPVDLVHQLSPAFPLPSQAPLVVTVHDLLPLSEPQWYAPRARTAFVRAVRYAAARAAAVIAVSDTVRAEVLDRLGLAPDRVHTVPTGVRLPGVVPARPATGGRYVLAVGEVGPRKNLEVVLRALERWPGGPDLVVVGADGPQAAGTRAAAGPLGDRVRFTGRQPDAVVSELLAGALAVVAPATYEGFGLVPLEAMAHGVPVVASTGGALPEVVGDAGLYADPQDPDAWAARLRSLADPGVADRLRVAGFARAAAASWEACAEATRAVYRGVLVGTR